MRARDQFQGGSCMHKALDNFLKLATNVFRSFRKIKFFICVKTFILMLIAKNPTHEKSIAEKMKTMQDNFF